MKTYLIGEIGQNHNGLKDVAKILADVAATDSYDSQFNKYYKGWDAVKLTLRDLNYELTQEAMNKAYIGKNSFGKTYGKHREYLELSIDEHIDIFDHVKSLVLDYVVTLCAPSLVSSLLSKRTPDKLKVASRDLTNIPLLESLSETKLPIILSTGMADRKVLDNALNIITKVHQNISILHCVSQYPTEYKNVNLNTISYLIKHYPKYTIGYSDHTIGISTPLAAVSLGAEIIEKHITVFNKLKGTDQAGSLGIDGMKRLSRDIRLLEESMGIEDIFIADGVNSAKHKLERSLCINKDYDKGDVILEKDLIMLSPGDGFSWAEKEKVIGKKTSKFIAKHSTLKSSDLEL